MKTILLIDGNSILYRSYYATAYQAQMTLATSDGTAINGAYTFIKLLNNFIKTVNITFANIFVAFDEGKKTFRHELYPAYKGKRSPTPIDLINQIDIVKEYLDTSNIKWFSHPGYEADDIIGTLQKQLNDLDYKVMILSSDKDFFQLINSLTMIAWIKKGVKNIEYINLTLFQHQWHMDPTQMIDYKMLMGDQSDNIKGVDGIGAKRAATLINQWYNIDNLLNNLDKIPQNLQAKIKAAQHNFPLLRNLLTIKNDIADINISAWINHVPSIDQSQQKVLLTTFFNKYEMLSLLKTMEDW